MSGQDTQDQRTSQGRESARTPRKLSHDEHVLVGVRVRPISTEEKSRGEKSVWLADETERKVVVKRHLLPKSTTQTGLSASKARAKSNHEEFKGFNHVLGPKASNQHVYDSLVRDIVHSAISGVNGTVFAYGQTASGKTHTMKGQGTVHDVGPESEVGVIQAALADIFQHIAASTERNYLLRVSYLEIYNEKVNDLLRDDGTNLELRENKKGVFVKGCNEHIVVNFGHVLDTIEAGERRRHYGDTGMNDLSSRSHTIFRLIIESTPVQKADDSKSSSTPRKRRRKARISCLNFVDLAGSERMKQTRVEGVRAVESTYINKSLHTLGVVIHQLANGNSHVSFRDSVLTRILQSSLGGNARTAMICTVSPLLSNIASTRNTLLFGQRAVRIVNKPKENEVALRDAMIGDHSHQSEVDALRQHLGDKGKVPFDAKAFMRQWMQLKMNSFLNMVRASRKDLRDALQTPSSTKHGFRRPSRTDATRSLTESEESFFKAAQREAKLQNMEEKLAQRGNHFKEIQEENQNLLDRLQEQVQANEELAARLVEEQERHEEELNHYRRENNLLRHGVGVEDMKEADVRSLLSCLTTKTIPCLQRMIFFREFQRQQWIVADCKHPFQASEDEFSDVCREHTEMQSQLLQMRDVLDQQKVERYRLKDSVEELSETAQRLRQEWEQVKMMCEDQLAQELSREVQRERQQTEFEIQHSFLQKQLQASKDNEAYLSRQLLAAQEGTETGLLSKPNSRQGSVDSVPGAAKPRDQLVGGMHVPRIVHSRFDSSRSAHSATGPGAPDPNTQTRPCMSNLSAGILGRRHLRLSNVCVRGDGEPQTAIDTFLSKHPASPGSGVPAEHSSAQCSSLSSRDPMSAHVSHVPTTPTGMQPKKIHSRTPHTRGKRKTRTLQNLHLKQVDDSEATRTAGLSRARDSPAKRALCLDMDGPTNHLKRTGENSSGLTNIGARLSMSTLRVPEPVLPLEVNNESFERAPGPTKLMQQTRS